MQLVVLRGPMPVGPFVLQPGRQLLGREADCAIQLPSRRVSRHHCAVILDEDTVIVEDLGSHNGIYDSAGERVGLARLVSGDEVVVGDYLLQVQPLPTLGTMETPIINPRPPTDAPAPTASPTIGLDEPLTRLDLPPISPPRPGAKPLLEPAGWGEHLSWWAQAVLLLLLLITAFLFMPFGGSIYQIVAMVQTNTRLELGAGEEVARALATASGPALLARQTPDIELARRPGVRAAFVLDPQGQILASTTGARAALSSDPVWPRAQAVTDFASIALPDGWLLVAAIHPEQRTLGYVWIVFDPVARTNPWPDVALRVSAALIGVLFMALCLVVGIWWLCIRPFSALEEGIARGRQPLRIPLPFPGVNRLLRRLKATSNSR